MGLFDELETNNEAGTVTIPDPGYKAPETPEFAPREITPEETVAGQAEGIIKKGSPLLTQVETGAKKAAASRGLLNTTMAVQAGEEAVLGKALEIAKPDAATYAAAGLSAQQAGQEAVTTGYKGAISAELTGGQISQQKVADLEIAVQKAEAAGELSAQEATQQRALNEFVADHDVGMQKTQIAADIQIKSADLAVEDRKAYGDSANNIWQQYQIQYTDIVTMPDDVLNDAGKRSAIKNLNNMVKVQTDFLSAVYDVDIEWSSSGTGV